MERVRTVGVENNHKGQDFIAFATPVYMYEI
jgi:hypothetical protein